MMSEFFMSIFDRKSQEKKLCRVIIFFLHSLLVARKISLSGQRKGASQS